VAGLACEYPDLSAWASAGLAVFAPDFRSSGIAGHRRMRQAFCRRGLPAADPEAGDVLAGVDFLTSGGIADPGVLVLFGHSYGGYLAGRILTRDDRFRVAVCCEVPHNWRRATDPRPLQSRNVGQNSIYGTEFSVKWRPFDQRPE
jgi:dipeptidyl aminopeptidase/acylaminoacyl peptidase